MLQKSLLTEEPWWSSVANVLMFDMNSLILKNSKLDVEYENCYVNLFVRKEKQYLFSCVCEFV